MTTTRTTEPSEAEALKESVLMGFDAMRICMGELPVNRSVAEVVAWFGAMAEKRIGETTEPDRMKWLLMTIITNLRHGCNPQAVCDWYDKNTAANITHDVRTALRAAAKVREQGNG